jgi:hypothetical protein
MIPLSSSSLLRLTARGNIRRRRTASCRDRILERQRTRRAEFSWQYAKAEDRMEVSIIFAVTNSWSILQVALKFLSKTTFAPDGSAEPNQNFNVAQLQILTAGAFTYHSSSPSSTSLLRPSSDPCCSLPVLLPSDDHSLRRETNRGLQTLSQGTARKSRLATLGERIRIWWCLLVRYISSPLVPDLSQQLHITECRSHQSTHHTVNFACRHVLHNCVGSSLHNGRNSCPTP